VLNAFGVVRVVPPLRGWNAMYHRAPFWDRLILYTADLPSLVGQHAMSSHLYADDTHVYGACRAHDTKQFVGRLGECFDDVTSWMSSSHIQLSANKTEFLWFATPRR
jgi:hypothetical protein